jgi:molecular chaperone GrpE
MVKPMKTQHADKQHDEAVEPAEQPIVSSVSVSTSTGTDAEEWKQKYIRALADYQNLEKRMAVREDEIRKFAGEVILRKLLSPIDTLEKAATHIEDVGLGLSLKELYAALTSVGVKKMIVVGKPFDPYEMECIDVVEGEPETVVEEVTPGYTYNDKILRVAQVKVGKKVNSEK